MHRILQRRRVRKLRVVWASLALVALSLAACSALFTAWTWRQTRDLSQSFKVLQDRLEQVNTQRKAIVQLILEKRELLVLFNEQQTPYVKLDVVTTGQRPQKLQCIEGYATTPSAGPHSFHFVKSCQVSGLLRLDRGAELQAITGSSFRLHTVGSPSASPHVFSIFKVN
ncbi:hypothetical protein F2P81_018270 [Scophthalmus maximus]|uniref:Uncharacterized protein n=1 Tax=Scophthalmus maximus TaxID=52904 RepID=A0A6A4S9X9_SCOMX|nr:hypothetical protein F2P81_018270 [Scophthalmus maximus]